MGINVSARQFHNPLLESLVARRLLEYSLVPEQLELEITEKLSMKDPEESIRILASFKALGIGIAIDDFGTGYSNLAYPALLPSAALEHGLSTNATLVSRMMASGRDAVSAPFGRGPISR